MYTTRVARHIFLADLYLKQGIGVSYVIVDFICTGLLELQGVDYKMKNSWPQQD